MFVSLNPAPTDTFDEHQWRDHSLPLVILPERREVPLLPAQVEMWISSDGESEHDSPHLHYNCPLCCLPQNVDLHPTAVSPSFACCDTCGWDSLCWLDWSLPIGWRAYQAVVWQCDPNAVGIRSTVYADSLEAAEQRLVGQYGPNAVYIFHNEEDAAKPRSSKKANNCQS